MFNIVGNYDEATIRPLICQHLGALPAKAKALNSKRELTPVKGVVDNTFKSKLETPKANSVMLWFNDQLPYTLKNALCCDIAGHVLPMEYLDKINEKESAAYSVGD